MCGLVAIVNKYNNGGTTEQQDVFTTLMFLDMLRGDDSTGVFMVTNAGDVKGIKEADHSANFIRKEEYKDILKDYWKNGAALVGHNRKATKGSITDENAHPFLVDNNIVLVHNGTLFGDHKHHAEVEVDSHAIAHVLNDEPDHEVALQKINGAFALIWYDVMKEQLHFIRNSFRPLWWMETQSSYIWCSDPSMLEFAATKHRLNLVKGVTEFKEETLQTFTLSKNRGWEASNKELDLSSAYETTIVYPANSYVPPNKDACAYDSGWGFGHRGDAQDPPETKSVSPIFNLFEYEKSLCIKEHMRLSNKEYREGVLVGYGYDSKLLFTTFDYTYCNGRDDSSGFYLYGSVLEDPDILVRMWWDQRVITEERMVQIAGGQYVYSAKVAQKSWTALGGHSAPILPNTMGYCRIVANTPQLVFGGGIGDKQSLAKELMSAKH